MIFYLLLDHMMEHWLGSMPKDPVTGGHRVRLVRKLIGVPLFKNNLNTKGAQNTEQDSVDARVYSDLEDGQDATTRAKFDGKDQI